MASIFSSLYSSSSSSSSGLYSINLSDYAAIRNGSYRKLLVANYNLQNGSSKTNTVTERNWVVNKADRYAVDETTEDTETEENSEKKAYGTVQSYSTDLKSSTDKLMETGAESVYKMVEVEGEDGETSLQYDTDEIYKAVKSFVSDYNNAITAGAASNSVNVNRSASTMVNYTKANQNALNAIGITIGSDNKLSIDEETFKSADMERVQNLFAGKNSYGSQISSQAALMNTYAKSAAAVANTYTQSGTYNYFDYTSIFSSSV